MAAKVPVTAPTNLHATSLGPTSVALAWTAPSRGTPPITYEVMYRVKGTQRWFTGAITTNQTHTTLASLHQKTEYEIELFCKND